MCQFRVSRGIRRAPAFSGQVGAFDRWPMSDDYRRTPLQIRYPDHTYLDLQTKLLIERRANGISSELVYIPESLKSLEIV